MMWTSRRRRPLRRRFRIGFYIVSFILFLDIWSTLNGNKTFVHNLAANTITHIEDLPPAARNQKIFIIAQFWSSAEDLNDFWNESLLKLIDTLGSENVYLSILASKGLDDTEEILLRLDSEYLEPRNVARTVILDPKSHQDAIDEGPVDVHGQPKEGWIYTGQSEEKELRRIPYLSDLRNRGLQPLQKLYDEQGIKFDKILYLNDVHFQTRDVLSLLATNDGVYDVACSLDFHLTPAYYDTFALRDSVGNPTVSAFYPFFRSSDSRSAVLQGKPVPVKSCWNGMVFADAGPYYDREKKTSPGGGQHAGTQIEKGLTYRAIPDSLADLHVEGSECCLIHADLIARGRANKGLFLNPAVRVGYKRDKAKYKTTAYEDTHLGPDGLAWISLNEYVFGVWKHRFQRWTRPAWWDTRVVSWRVSKWKKEGRRKGEHREEVGEYCIIDEMHILLWNGWKHIR